jgi:hypothetical protein
MRLGFRFTTRRLLLAVAAVAVLLAGLNWHEEWTRSQLPRPPLPWPWWAPPQLVLHNTEVYVNLEDLLRGIDPPGVLSVEYPWSDHPKIRPYPMKMRSEFGKYALGFYNPKTGRLDAFGPGQHAVSQDPTGPVQVRPK